jgi:hypothetical protein
MNPKHLGINQPQNIVESLQYVQPLTERQKLEIENRISKADGKPYQRYYVDMQQYFTNEKIYSDCNSILFINTGTQAVNIQGVVLQQTQSLEIQGNRGEIDTTQYIISFPTPNNTGNNLTVVRKIYV